MLGLTVPPSQLDENRNVMPEPEGSSSPSAFAFVFLHPGYDAVMYSDDVGVRLLVVLVSHSVLDPVNGLVSQTSQDVEPPRQPPATGLAHGTRGRFVLPTTPWDRIVLPTTSCHIPTHPQHCTAVGQHQVACTTFSRFCICDIAQLSALQRSSSNGFRPTTMCILAQQ